MLIVAESWGVMKDARIQKSLISPLLDQQKSFDWVMHGTMRTETATVGAELRELCGLETQHYNLKSVAEGFENCLPKKLKNLGYATAAIHGSTGIMYDRVHWYPRAGFDEIRFHETDPWETRCYSFPGTCDREIMDKYISHVFRNDGKRFVYWLTLNTHAIYDKRDIHDDLFDCTQYQLPEDGEICRLTKLHAQFFHQLADILKQKSMHGVEVLIVGDHPPRILNMMEKEAHIESGLVSWVHFRIKDN
ncbi:sulfatase-like hydrolase/transferase [Thauera butanivorans]|uniref:sulfatase-like hydrolase/transferase n=1 Tax=Thauera butanivorans TaxID=86174 RepID=UPI0012FBCA3E|nr:sulfatase-like hydrolase/transferase [Thauera butanivorans]